MAALFDADSSAEAMFSDVRIIKPFDRYMTANPELMDSTGAKIIRMAENQCLLVVVASTVLNTSSAADRLRAEKVCKTRAFAYLVQEQKGVQVFHSEQSTEKLTSVSTDSEDSSTSVSAFLEITKTKVEGIAKDLPVVGHWKSKDGKIFYLAIGGILNKKGNLVRTGPEKTE